jgi:hypothetical protein
VPQFVIISGNFSAGGLANPATATNIAFVGQDGVTTYSGQTSGSRYTINNLPNQGIYTVKITFNPAPLGNSPCTAGVIVIYLQVSTPIIHNWSC